MTTTHAGPLPLHVPHCPPEPLLWPLLLTRSTTHRTTPKRTTTHAGPLYYDHYPPDPLHTRTHPLDFFPNEPLHTRTTIHYDHFFSTRTTTHKDHWPLLPKRTTTHAGPLSTTTTAHQIHYTQGPLSTMTTDHFPNEPLPTQDHWPTAHQIHYTQGPLSTMTTFH